jgi:phosphoenolpyruvate carboxykinase (GTP)
VLKWVFERVAGKGKAKETAIGYMPTEDAIDTTGLNVSAADMKELLNVNKDEWKEELASIREHYAKFGTRFPNELNKELEGLEKRLG